MRKFENLLFVLLAFTLVLTACEDDDVPPEENEEEIITDVTLTFTPLGGGSPVVATAQDPDGEGPQDIAVVDNIVLATNTTYELSLDLVNSIANESITEEVEEEDEEHMFFFGWTNDLFADPAGDGNIGPDARGDAVNYNDQDDNGNPLGLSTTWTTADAASGTFRVILKHQPNIKTDQSTSQDGESDIDLSWSITVQ